MEDMCGVVLRVLLLVCLLLPGADLRGPRGRGSRGGRGRQRPGLPYQEHALLRDDEDVLYSGSGEGFLATHPHPHSTEQPIFTTYPAEQDEDFIFVGKGYNYDEGSADGNYDDYWDDRDNNGDKEGSGAGSPDDEDFEGSADAQSPCQKLRDELNGKKLIGAYIPRCTLFGEFEPMQCHGSTGECWCVNRMGQQIPGTMRRSPEIPNCEDIDRETMIPQAPDRANGGRNKPEEETPNMETEKPGPPTDTNDPYVIDTPSQDNSDKFDNKDDGGVEIIDNNGNTGVESSESVYNTRSRASIIEQPGILAGIIGGAVVGLLCAVLLVMFIVYRMRKKDEGSYALDEPKRSPSITYSRARDKEFFA